MPLSGLRRSLKRVGLYGIDCSRTDTKEQTESTDKIEYRHNRNSLK